MKIYDIITEQSQPLTEMRFVITTAIDYAISRGVGAIERVLAWLAGRVASKPKAAEELAEAWVYLAEKSGMTVEEAIVIGARSAEGKVSDDVIRLASEKARVLGEKLNSTMWRKLKDPNSAFNFWYGLGMKKFNQALIAYGILEPVAECIWEISKLYKMREEGHPELQDINKLSWGVQWHIDQCVKQVASLLAANFLFGQLVKKWVPGTISILWPLNKLFAALDPLYKTATPAALAGFKVYMMSDAGREAVAKFLVGELMVPGTDWKVPGGKLWQNVIDTLSGLAKTGYDHVLRWTGNEDKAKPLPGGKDDPNKPTNPSSPAFGAFKHDSGTGAVLK